MSGIKPLLDRVVVERAEKDEKTSGGILLPSSAQEKSVVAMVHAVGNGRTTDDGKTIAPSVKIGDKVLLPKWGGDEIKLDGKEYLILKESDILAILS